VPGLQPSDSTTRIISTIAGEHADLMLVGHFPQMPQLLGHLLHGLASPPVVFPKNGMVALENVDGVWVERWRTEAISPP
jgi:phosphohistidine phosphatase SixA